MPTHEELRVAIVNHQVVSLWWFAFNEPQRLWFNVWSPKIPWVDLHDKYHNLIDTLKPEGE